MAVAHHTYLSGSLLTCTRNEQLYDPSLCKKYDIILLLITILAVCLTSLKAEQRLLHTRIRTPKEPLLHWQLSFTFFAVLHLINSSLAHLKHD
ncbi:hypothetical protein KIN20_020531 [Parelaphostrongylus tenuis]|uniref:Uncharacterized protein n=1 Tax=Parelaphostrongylus tenuis TaxID=148309 RepID=A0AAD5QTT3_PARTN|nr:hypothetical protein KIN20_020531 [Parelaphostrongylus tenuis]